MPRAQRQDGPEVWHHVRIRGVGGQTLFFDDRDRLDFLTRLAAILVALEMELASWALIPNHVHLVVRSGPVASLSKAMHRLLTGYARHHNERYAGQGYVFQDRFWSRPVLSDSYWYNLIRYVFLNPVEAGLATLTNLHEYPWSGYSVIWGHQQCPAQRVDDLLAHFHDDEAAARRLLHAWLAEGVSANGAVIVPEAEDEQEGGASERPARGILVPAVDSFEELVAGAAGACGCSPSEVPGSRKRSAREARALVAHIAVSRMGISGAEVARLLGVAKSTVSRALTRGRALEPRLARWGEAAE